MPNVKTAETTTTTGSFVPLPGQEVKKEEATDMDKMDTTDATSASAKDVAGQKRRREDESGEFFSSSHIDKTSICNRGEYADQTRHTKMKKTMM